MKLPTREEVELLKLKNEALEARITELEKAKRELKSQTERANGLADSLVAQMTGVRERLDALEENEARFQYQHTYQKGKV